MTPRRIKIREHRPRRTRTSNTHRNPRRRAVLESTANYWIRIHDTLEGHSIDTILANPRKTKLIAEAKIKSDKLVARTLATLLQGNLVFESYVPPKAKRENRTLVRHRAGFVKTRTEIRNRIHAILAKHELEHDYSGVYSKQSIPAKNFHGC